MKKCLGCQQEKDEAAFGKRTRNEDGLQTRCKECWNGHARERDGAPGKREKRNARSRNYAARKQAEVNEKQRVRREKRKVILEANPVLKAEMLAMKRRYKEKLGPEGRRDASLRQKYGFSLAQERQMILDQDGRCAICTVKKKLVVDHCHTTGKVRGLLCHACNRSIGMLGDDLPGLMRAVRYLQEKGQTFEPLTFIA